MTANISRRHTLGLPLAIAASAYASRSTGTAGDTSHSKEEVAAPPTRFFPSRNRTDHKKPVGLVVYLDGDGQELHDHDGDEKSSISGGFAGADGIVGAATSRSYDVLSVRTPQKNQNNWWSRSKKTTNDSINHLKRTIQEESHKHSCKTGQLWLVGYSGGSEFITQDFFPNYANSITTGGFIVFGGGDSPKGSPKFTERSQDTLSLNWVTGKLDTSKYPEYYDALGHAQRSIERYCSHGFHHTWNDWPDTDHEGIVEKFGHYVGLVLDREK